MNALTDIRAVRELLDRHGFHFSKKLGQNFLINPSVCPRMAEACLSPAAGGITGTDAVTSVDAVTGVLEIGPGIGVLTRELAARADRVTAVELDGRLLPVLEETLAGCDNVRVRPGDAMKLDLAALLAEDFPGMRTAVCANLPYYITSPLLMRLLESRLPVSNVTVMVQKEAAARLCADPGTRECGAVSLAVRYYAEARPLFDVSRGSFLPAPTVDSTVIQLTIREKPPVAVADEGRLFRLIRAGFGQRRKTLVNALAGGGWDKRTAAEMAEAAGLPPQVRAEQLTLEDFARLCNAGNA